jgi:hypothetical protein
MCERIWKGELKQFWALRKKEAKCVGTGYRHFHLKKGKAKKKICVFTVTRPTLIFASDPMHFYTEFG